MLKTQTLRLPGRDASEPFSLTELPALVADRYARRALESIGEPPDGGVVALALKHSAQLLQSGERALDMLQPFVQASRQLHDWRNVMTVQQAALALHVGFLVGRQQVDIPVGLQAAGILKGGAGVGVHFCSPHIACVLHSGRATYRELETYYSTEDVYNIVELLNVEAVRDWHAKQKGTQT